MASPRRSNRSSLKSSPASKGNNTRRKPANRLGLPKLPVIRVGNSHRSAAESQAQGAGLAAHHWAKPNKAMGQPKPTKTQQTSVLASRKKLPSKFPPTAGNIPSSKSNTFPVQEGVSKNDKALVANHRASALLTPGATKAKGNTAGKKACIHGEKPPPPTTAGQPSPPPGGMAGAAQPTHESAPARSGRPATGKAQRNHRSSVLMGRDDPFEPSPPGFVRQIRHTAYGKRPLVPHAPAPGQSKYPGFS